VDYQIRSCTLF